MEEEGKSTKIFLVTKMLGLVFSTIFIFIGFLYFLRSDFLLSALLTLLAIGGFLGITHFLVSYKRKKVNLRNYTPEYVLGFAYLILFLVTAPFIFHATDIEINQKSAIKDAGTQKLNQLKLLMDEYTKKTTIKIQNFESEVEAVKNRMTDQFSNKAVAQNDINALLGDRNVRHVDISQVDELKRQKTIFLKSNYSLGKLNTETKAFYDNTLPVFKNWQIQNLSYAYYNIDNQFANYRRAALVKMPDFVYVAAVAPAIELDSPMHTLANASLGGYGMGLFVLLILHFLILSHYIFTKPPRRFIERNTNNYTPPEGGRTIRIN